MQGWRLCPLPPAEKDRVQGKGRREQKRKRKEKKRNPDQTSPYLDLGKIGFPPRPATPLGASAPALSFGYGGGGGGELAAEAPRSGDIGALWGGDGPPVGLAAPSVLGEGSTGTSPTNLTTSWPPAVLAASSVPDGGGAFSTGVAVSWPPAGSVAFSVLSGDDEGSAAAGLVVSLLPCGGGVGSALARGPGVILAGAPDPTGRLPADRALDVSVIISGWPVARPEASPSPPRGSNLPQSPRVSTPWPRSHVGVTWHRSHRANRRPGRSLPLLV